MTSGLISHIQGYSTKDGPGIRTTVFMMQCNLRCLWCSNPEAMLPGKKVLYYVNRCQRCGSCVRHSSDQAVTMTADGCVIDRRRCTNLAEMVNICNYQAYELKGQDYTPEQLAAKLLRDKTFYDVSGGGVTFSGGEPALQYQFVHETVKLLKKQGVHTALDTAGLFDMTELDGLINDIDLVILDLKTFDRQLHQQLTGVDNTLILHNAQAIAARHKPMIISLVIVPTLNDQENDVIRRLDFIKNLAADIRQVDLLKYHNYGAGKYQALGIPYPLSALPLGDDDQLKHFQQLGLARGLNTTIGG
ncbi:Benzylsuccinate synthase activating enzyme [bioreactor metagenome]|uniref:Benzylsuccinate synthase activating enzyme n=1 Tax=bioreactor metagenome TaxID=1076179 RepID=A0A645ERM3_9ZZZZ